MKSVFASRVGRSAIAGQEVYDPKLDMFVRVDSIERDHHYQPSVIVGQILSGREAGKWMTGGVNMACRVLEV